MIYYSMTWLITVDVVLEAIESPNYFVPNYFDESDFLQSALLAQIYRLLTQVVPGKGAIVFRQGILAEVQGNSLGWRFPFSKALSYDARFVKPHDSY